MIPEQEKRMQNVIKTTRAVKGRLLHYFPQTADKNKEVDSWCTWHWDNSLLTGLTSALFMDSEGKALPRPEPDIGLFNEDQEGTSHLCQWSADQMGFQTGELVQIYSGGLLRAPR